MMWRPMPRRSVETRSQVRWRRTQPALWMGLAVVALHAMPGGELGAHDWWMNWRLDVLLHAALFGLFGLSALIALRKGGEVGAGCRYAWCWVLGGGMLIAVVLEAAQGAIFPDRGSDPWDLVADFIGLFLAGIAFRALYLMWPVGKKTH